MNSHGNLNEREVYKSNSLREFKGPMRDEIIICNIPQQYTHEHVYTSYDHLNYPAPLKKTTTNIKAYDHIGVIYFK